MQLITVGIPALNEAKNIARCIESIKTHAPDGLELEIVVGDHGSTDGTPEIATTLGARVLHFSGGTVGNLRNRIVAASKGTILIFLDADTAVTEQWGVNLAAAISALEREPLQITGSLCVVPDVGNPFIKYWFAKIRRKDSGYLGTGHLIVSRQLFEKIGGFDSELRSGEDYDFCVRAKRAGAALVVRPDLTVVHYDYPLNAGDFIRREVWHGSGDFQSFRRLLQSKVALAALMFTGVQLLSIALLFFDLRYFLIAQIVSFGAVALQSFLKFPELRLNERVANIAIFHLYLFGRSVAMLSALLTKLTGSRK